MLMDKMNRENFPASDRGFMPPDFVPGEQIVPPTEFGEDKPAWGDERKLGNVSIGATNTEPEGDHIGAVLGDNGVNDGFGRNAVREERSESRRIKTNENLSSEGVQMIDNAVEAFKKDGDAASFYEKARGYMEANLENSYQRKLGKQ